ncbi:XIAP-associated factor 1 [Jatropha curcas]|uniref:XIAP-associated factor 1 n=1 Tax=Jatropha curcas TaxID=180498 RepID=UPI00189544F0|nr:XIAP-associated factor 1 [Jatropha curcas]
MAISPEDSTTICTNCEKAIPAPNINLHIAHCTRKLERCKFCRETVPKREAQRHYSNKPDVRGNQIPNCHRCRRQRYINAGRRDQRGNAWPRRDFLYTVAITGAAFFLGSVFFQRKDDNNGQLI